MSSEYMLGMDIGGTNIRLGLVDRDGTVHAFEKHGAEEIRSEDPPAALARLTAEYISRIDKNAVVRRICAGFPAAVDRARTTVLNAPNLPGFDGVRAGDVLEAALGIPVCIERDVNLLLLSDLLALGIDGGDIAACYIGTGIGNAIMLDGKLFVGHNGVAGELGHIPYGDLDTVCGCGNPGCAETAAGGVYLARLQKERFPDIPMQSLFTCRAEDPALREYVVRLARTIAAEINIIDPEYLLLGGGVIAMADFPKAALEEAILASVRKPLPYENLKILYAENDGMSGVRGAGLYAWRTL